MTAKPGSPAIGAPISEQQSLVLERKSLEPTSFLHSSFDVGRRLQSIRQSIGLSQRELARRANITNGSLSMIEQGKVSPSISSLEKILKLYS